MESNYRNKNRGYQQLRVWQDAQDLYVSACKIFRKFPYDLKRVASQAIASADSVHRNIAEGYCRRSLREYLQFLNIGLGSLGEFVSGIFAYHKAEQITQAEFDSVNNLTFKLENGLLKLVESLERKQESGDWIDSLIIKESNVAYGKKEEESQESPAPSMPPQSMSYVKTRSRRSHTLTVPRSDASLPHAGPGSSPQDSTTPPRHSPLVL